MTMNELNKVRAIIRESLKRLPTNDRAHNGQHLVTLKEQHRHTTWTFNITIHDNKLRTIHPIQTEEWAFDPYGKNIELTIEAQATT